MEMDKYLEILSAQIRNSRARAMAVKENVRQTARPDSDV